MKKRLFIKASIVAGAIALAACSDDDNDNNAVVNTGQFIDAPVEGIGYRTATQSGVTDADGNYDYLEGEEVTFFLGDLEFPPVPASGIVTPLDIARVADSEATLDSNIAINIGRLLQSLDSDDDPSNGIDVSNVTAANSIDFSADTPVFEAAFATEFAAEVLVTVNEARAHLQQELEALDIDVGGGTTITPPDANISGSITNPNSVSGQWELLIDDVFANDGGLTASTSVSFNSTPVNNGQTFEVRVSSADCSVTNGSGTISEGVDVNNIAIVCQGTATGGGGTTTPPDANISGSIVNPDSVSGQWELLIDGVFANDGGLTASTSVSFTSSPVDNGKQYAVTVSNTECTVSNGSGTIANGVDVTDVAIVCQAASTGGGGTGGGTTTPPDANLSGSIVNPSNLPGQWELFVDSNLVNDGALTTSVSVSFSGTPVNNGQAYEVRASNEECVVTNGSGTMSDGVDVTNISIVCPVVASGPNGTTTDATINSALVGDYTLIYDQSSVGGGYEDQQEVMVNIASNGSLTIGTLTLDNPFNRDLGAGPHLPEIIWLDPNTNLEYALSNNEFGSFNEINLGDASNPIANGIPAFLGQFRVDEGNQAAADVVGQYAGTYTLEVTYIDSKLGYDLGDTFIVTIDDTGAVTYQNKAGDNITIDPTENTYNFYDSRGSTSINPGLDVYHNVPDTDEGTQERVTFGFEGEEIIGFRIGFGFTAVLKPLPDEVTALIDNLIAASPVTMRVVLDDPSYGGSFVPRGGKCQEIVVEMQDPGETSFIDSELQIGLGYYSRFDWRYQLVGRGDEILGKNGIQVRRTSTGDLQLDEGFANTQTLLIEPARDQATTNATTIDAVCGDYNILPIKIVNHTDSIAQAIIVIKDSDTDGEIVRFPYDFTQVTVPANGELLTPLYVQNAVNYEVVLETVSSTEECTSSNATGTASSANAEVVYECGSETVTEPAGFNVTGSIQNSDNLSGQWELFINDVFHNDGGLATNNDVSFNFALQADGATYEVRASNSNCTVTNGTGTINGADVTDVAIVCADPVTPSGFNVTGVIRNSLNLSGQWEFFINGTLRHDGSLADSSDVSFYFDLVPDGSSYEVRSSNPSCIVNASGTGTINGADVTDVAIVCAD